MTGVDREKVEQSLLTNRHNKLTTTYHLLLKKRLRGGHNSPADLSAPDFMPKKKQVDSMFLSQVNRVTEQTSDRPSSRKTREKTQD